MKIAEFNYTAKSGETTARHIAVITESKEAIQGIDLDKLNAEEARKFAELQVRYEAELKPFMKAFRRFNLVSMTDRVDNKMVII